MTRSLRALLAGSVDYAGMFPPAGLPLAQSIDELRRHRGGSAAWMLGRFVVPAAKLAELAETYRVGRDGRLSVIVPAGDSGESFLQHLDVALTSIARFPIRGAVDTLEFRWPVEPLREASAGRLGNLVQAAAGQVVASRIEQIAMFFEPPRHEMALADSTGREIVRAAVTALADFNKTARTLNCLAGFKLRCAETEGAGIPSSAEIAAVICDCRDHGLYWKATAGLHHPLRHVDPQRGIPMHGFLNLLVAAVFADVHRLNERQVEAILETVDARQFSFSGGTLQWRELSLTDTQVAAARERSLRSFGSCSFDEPVGDLRALGWL